MAVSKKAKKVIDPFTVIEGTAKKTSKSGLKDVTVPKKLVAAIDDYARIHAEIKSLEGEKEQCRNEIEPFAKEKYAERLFEGTSGNFKLSGEKSVVSFITMAKSKNIGQTQYEELEQTWGSEVVETCLKKDIGTVKFDSEVYEAHKELINKTIAALGEKIGAPLFVGMAYKVPKNILEIVASQVESAEDLKQLLAKLEITTQIRVSK